jgi:hypothetical protein
MLAGAGTAPEIINTLTTKGIKESVPFVPRDRALNHLGKFLFLLDAVVIKHLAHITDQ